MNSKDSALEAIGTCIKGLQAAADAIAAEGEGRDRLSRDDLAALATVARCISRTLRPLYQRSPQAKTFGP